MKKPETYSVWHDKGWPQSRLDQTLGGHPPSRFPDDYFHAADVKASSLQEAVDKTTSTGSFIEGDQKLWNMKEGVQSFTPAPYAPRDTQPGDVVCGYDCVPYRVEDGGFKEIPASERPNWQTVAEVGREERQGTVEEMREIERRDRRQSYREMLAESAPAMPHIDHDDGHSR